jgi:hypothetical protein
MSNPSNFIIIMIMLMMNPLKFSFNVNCLYRAVNALHPDYRNRSINAVQRYNRCSNNHKEFANTLYLQDVEFFVVKLGGTSSNYWNLNGR